VALALPKALTLPKAPTVPKLLTLTKSLTLPKALTLHEALAHSKALTLPRPLTLPKALRNIRRNKTTRPGDIKDPLKRRILSFHSKMTNRTRPRAHSGGNDRFCARLKTDISAFSSGLQGHLRSCLQPFHGLFYVKRCRVFKQNDIFFKYFII
jgi:hypothetical protein